MRKNILMNSPEMMRPDVGGGAVLAGENWLARFYCLPQA